MRQALSGKGGNRVEIAKDSSATAPSWRFVSRRLALGAVGIAGLGASAAVVEHIWRKKDISARLFNPFSLAHFELAPVPGLLDAEGRPVPGFSSADLNGKRSVLNVWASWCPSCRAEHPLLMGLAKRKLAPIYGADVKDPPERARYFLARHGNPFTAVGADAQTYLQRAMGARGVPATFVIGPGLEVEWSTYEPLDEDVLENQLIPALSR